MSHIDIEAGDGASRWSIFGAVAATAVLAAGCLFLLFNTVSPSSDTAGRDDVVAAVTLIVGGMMKSRSGAT